MSPVQSGDVLKLERYEFEQAKTALISIEWSQNFATRRERYFALNAKNKSQGDTLVAIFIQKDWFADDEDSNNIANYATVKGEYMTFTVDNRFQYGQKNSNGEARFVVYHDKEHRPYQHRFVEGAITGLANKASSAVKDVPVWGDLIAKGASAAKNFVGDYMHDF